MNGALWVAQVFLALVFAGTGAFKLAQSPEHLAPVVGDWVLEFPALLVKSVGAAELLAAVGLLLPTALGVATELTAAAACGIAVLMVGAGWVNALEKKPALIVVNVLLAILATFIAWGRCDL